MRAPEEAKMGPYFTHKHRMVRIHVDWRNENKKEKGKKGKKKRQKKEKKEEEEEKKRDTLVRPWPWAPGSRVTLKMGQSRTQMAVSIPFLVALRKSQPGSWGV